MARSGFSLVFISLIISIIALIIITPNYSSPFNSSLNFAISIIIFFNSIVYLRSETKKYNNWLRFDLIFFVGFLIVHFQIPFLYSIGITPVRDKFIFSNLNVVNFATWLSGLCLLIWILGYKSFQWLKLHLKYLKFERRKYIVNDRKVRIIAYITFILFLFTVGSSFLSGSYAGTKNWGAGATYFLLICKICLYLSVIYFFINNKERLKKYGISSTLNGSNIILLLFLIMYSLVFLTAGDRGPIMQLSLVLITSYVLFVARLNFITLFTLMALAIFVFNIIRFGRTKDASQREGNILVEGYQNLSSSETDINPTNELASSVRILYRALDAVPDDYPYFYGSTIIMTVVEIFPFGGTLLFQLYSIPIIYTKSSLFFTYLGQGEYSTWGEGSEIIADLYINFGPIFAVAVFFFFGLLVAFLTFQAQLNLNHKYLIAYILFTTMALYINRADLFSPTKMIVYALIIDRYLVTKKIIT